MSGTRRDRERATEAFRKWARAGCPVGENIRENGTGTEADFRACEAVFCALEKEERMGRENSAAREIRMAVRAVYMEEPRRPLHRAEITMRVRRVAVERYVSERQVYAWLARARVLWWRFRR